MDKINQIRTNRSKNFFSNKASKSLEQSTEKNSNLQTEEIKKTATQAMSSIYQQRNNTVNYDFSHFNSDDDNKGIKFLA